MKVVERRRLHAWICKKALMRVSPYRLGANGPGLSCLLLNWRFGFGAILGTSTRWRDGKGETLVFVAGWSSKTICKKVKSSPCDLKRLSKQPCGKRENLAVHPYICRLRKRSPFVDVRIQPFWNLKAFWPIGFLPREESTQHEVKITGKDKNLGGAPFTSASKPSRHVRGVRGSSLSGIPVRSGRSPGTTPQRRRRA